MHAHEEQQKRAAAAPVKREGRGEGAAALSGIAYLQRLVGNRAVQRLIGEKEDPIGGVLNGGGAPMAANVRADMEHRFGEDFSQVRVHTDSAAHASARAVGATAYTSGTNLVFQRGMYDPSSAAGRTVLAHELTHVVQQRSGPVDGTATAAGYRVSDPSDRFEQAATANAARIVDLENDASTVAPQPVQREASDEEEMPA